MEEGQKEILVPWLLLVVFLVSLSSVIIPRLPKLFFKKPFARTHRLAGLVNLLLLAAGVSDVRLEWLHRPAFHLALACAGLATTLTAARDFRASHLHTRNIASGSLDPSTTISYSEMVEHAFYQLLLLLQVLYLHAAPSAPLPARAGLLLLTSSPWLLRTHFPINSFSANYTQSIPYTTRTTRLLYRLKKYQYVLYKHFLLHGLNISLALSPSAVSGSPLFCSYWMAINMAYLMEFFMQTLMKKGHMSFGWLVGMQGVLMAASSVVAVMVILRWVWVGVALVSLVLNFVNRGREMVNVTVTLVFGLAYQYLWEIL